MEDKKTQKIQKSSWGGARPGAGRKMMNGSEEPGRKLKRKFNEYITEEEIQAIVAGAVADAMNGKEAMQKFVLEQVFGKAKQTTIQEDDDGNLLAPVLVKILRESQPVLDGNITNDAQSEGNSN